MDEQSRKKTIARLRRAAGQIEGIARMLEEKRSCDEVLVQLSAARAALGRVAQLVLEAHMRDVLNAAMASKTHASRDQLASHLVEVFGRYCAS